MNRLFLLTGSILISSLLFPISSQAETQENSSQTLSKITFEDSDGNNNYNFDFDIQETLNNDVSWISKFYNQRRFNYWNW